MPAGHYIMTVQGQLDKVLTPISEEIIFEIAQANGGKISVLDESDAKGGVLGAVVSSVTDNWPMTIVIIMVIIIAGVAIWFIMKKVKRRKNETPSL